MRLGKNTFRTTLGVAALFALAFSAACGGDPGPGGADGGSGGGADLGSGGSTSPAVGGGTGPAVGGGANPGIGGGTGPAVGGGANPGIGGSGDPGSGGMQGMGAGDGAGGGDPGAGGSGELYDCTITASHTQSIDIATVFTVEFTSDLAGADSARINFGKVSDGFTLVAHVDDGASSALLLGMANSTEYQYQIVVTDGIAVCTSETMTLTTGGFPGGSGLANATITGTGSSSSPVEPGFIVSSTGVGQGQYAYIVNHLGELVWWYPTPFGEVSRARMSFDGKHMYARELNVGRAQSGRLLKVAMDGSGEEVTNLATSHHDFAVTPDGSLLYIAGSGGGTCDGIFKFPGDELLFVVSSAFPTYGGTGGLGNEECHTNAIQYNDFDKSVTFSETNHNAYVNFDYATGDLNWVYGGSTDSDYSGDSTWDREHGLHMTDADTIYFFNNGAFNGGQSHIYRAKFSGGVASWDWHYSSNANSGTLGDVQELPGGNVLVTYSSGNGIIHEVDSSEQLVQSMNMPFTNCGYANHRPTLYGAPPR